MKKLSILVLIVALSLFASLSIAAEPIDAIKNNIKASTAAVTKSVPSVTVQEFKKIQDEGKEFFELIDVREKDEFDAGHLADAIWAPRGKAEWMVPEAVKDPNATIYVYCKAGSRGALVVRMLLDAGYTKVINISGGFKEWAMAGYPFYNLHGQVIVTQGGFGKKPE